jgi:predicted enzyme related to lactoylglutathione lyase
MTDQSHEQTGKEIQMASDMRLELIQVPVSDIDRAKTFYVEKVGFNLDHDHQVSDELRFVQLTPPGSACSIALTSGSHRMSPGSIEGLQMVVEDAEATRRGLAERGVDVSDVQMFPWGNFVFFTDPDGNGWALQAIPHPEQRAKELPSTDSPS